MATTINASTSAGLVSTADTSGVLQLQAANTTVLNAELGKALALQGATSTTGCGIAFPATQVASTDVNTLDDYKEGTFTPILSGFTIVGSPTYSGKYTKIGNMIFATVYINPVSASTVASTANTSSITGLPNAASVSVRSVCYASSNQVANYGTGLLETGGTLYPPTWVANSNFIMISVVYYV
jgi:hypothetical protein